MAETNTGKSKLDTFQEGNEDDVFDLETKVGKLSFGDPLPEIPVWLQDVESPFNWLPVRFSDVPAREVITKATERIQMDEGFDDTFPFEKLVRILTLVYEYAYHGDEVKAQEQLTLCEQLIEVEKDKNETTYNQLQEALRHTIPATKAHLLYRTGRNSEAKQIAETVLAVGAMSDNDKAAIQAMKARFFYLYRSQGVKIAVQCAKEALRLSPNNPLWQVLVAEATRRLRKFLPSSEQLSNDEVPLLELAVSGQRNARHLVLLAQAYRERGDAIFKLHRSEPDFFQSQTFLDICDMQAKAFDLYKEALSVRPDDEVVNRLCGYGLLKLPAFKSDYRLAQRCLQRALQQSPNNPTTIHSLGLYYYKGLMEYEKAALFCEKAGKLGNFPASLDMLRMKRLVYGNNYDPKFDFGKLLQQYGDDLTKRHEVLCQMGSYFLFFERDLPKALKYFRMLIKENAEQSIMTSHKCTFLNMANKINLYECIVNEGTRLLNSNETSDTEKLDDNSLADIKNFLNDLRVLNLELFNAPVNKNLIDELHKVSDDIKQTYIRKKERRESYKDKRSSFSRHNSIDENKTPSRRKSENGEGYRRRFSGSNDGFQSHNLKTSISKQKICNGSLSNVSESVNNETERNYQKRYSYKRSNSYNSETNHGSFRRRSSGGETGRNLNYNYKPFTTTIPNIKEVFPPGEGPRDQNENKAQTKQNRLSWSGKSTNENQIIEDWRKKDKKGKTIEPEYVL